MKKLFLVLTLFSAALIASAQKKTTSSATVTFDATTPKDALPKATNNTVIGSLNTETGAVAFEAAVKNFAFSNPSIQEHFNGDKWLNSDKYPSFTFTGKIDGLKKVKFNQNGTYKANVKGSLTIRDKTEGITTPVTFVVNNGKVTATTSFKFKLSDYDIKGVPIESGKVAPEPKVTVSATF